MSASCTAKAVSDCKAAYEEYLWDPNKPALFGRGRSHFDNLYSPPRKPQPAEARKPTKKQLEAKKGKQAPEAPARKPPPPKPKVTKPKATKPATKQTARKTNF